MVFSWLLVLQLIHGDRANVKALSRHGLVHLAHQHYQHLFCAAYGCTKGLLWWFADQALQAFPRPEDGISYLISDSTLKGMRLRSQASWHTFS
jgi:hypothetical protein